MENKITFSKTNLPFRKQINKMQNTFTSPETNLQMTDSSRKGNVPHTGSDEVLYTCRLDYGSYGSNASIEPPSWNRGGTALYTVYGPSLMHQRQCRQRSNGNKITINRQNLMRCSSFFKQKDKETN